MTDLQTLQPLRPFQKDAIERLTQGTSCHMVVVAPTGYGKSRIFEHLARAQRWRVLVISPLRALNEQHRELLANCQSKVEVQTPESLLTSKGQRNLHSFRPNFWVMDECHTLAEWGLTFRPALRKIYSSFHSHLPPRSLWLSATLPTWIRRDLTKNLHPVSLQWIEVAPRTSPTITFAPTQAHERIRVLTALLKSEKHSGLIFCHTRASCERVYRWLLQNVRNLQTYLYHAGLPAELRQNIETTLQKIPTTARVIVSTSAFGMGMNLKDLAWVIFFEPPRSTIELQQVLGRASRRIEITPKCLVFYDNSEVYKNCDVEIQKIIFSNSAHLNFLHG